MPIVVGHEHPVRWRERLQRDIERESEHPHIARALRLVRIVVIAIRVDPRILSVVVEGLRAALRADVIDVTLREKSTHPGQDRAAAVEVFEYRAPPPVAHLEAINVGPHRIGEFAPANLITSDRARRGIERRPKARDEVLPPTRVSTFPRHLNPQTL